MTPVTEGLSCSIPVGDIRRFLELVGRYHLLGGPGASGVDAINGVGDLIQGILGTEYDIVGFDPRCDFVFLT